MQPSFLFRFPADDQTWKANSAFLYLYLLFRYHFSEKLKRLFVVLYQTSIFHSSHNRDHGLEMWSYLAYIFTILFLSLSIEKIFKTLEIVFITFPNTSNFVKNTPLRGVFSTLFSVFGNVMKHCLSCFIYYLIDSFKKKLLKILNDQSA